jgi:hypothetical protein
MLRLFMGFLGFFMDLGGSSDLDGSSWILVVLRIWMVLHGSWWFFGFGLPWIDFSWFFRTWMVFLWTWMVFFGLGLVFSGDTAVSQAYDHSTHTYISTGRGC